jgi:hypothetical protein
MVKIDENGVHNIDPCFFPDDSMSTVSTLFPSGQFSHRDLGHYSYVEGQNETPIKNPVYQRFVGCASFKSSSAKAIITCVQ